ncbi:hypothetical protein BX600DRAFT_430086 [Xylariales sp. PMI_506]|nr:hypothetical protein BX600DRAFT_430086 [Xylariales sp. PMI_506]
MDARRKSEPASPLHRLGRWLRLKQYQVEVTFAVYMFTPTEKFVFWSVVFLLFSMTTIAAVLYLPQHIAFLIDRAWFYAHGREGASGSIAANLLGKVGNSGHDAAPLNVLSNAAAEATKGSLESIAREL